MLLFFLLACSPSAADTPQAAPPPAQTPQTIVEGFPPPQGAKRVAPTKFGAWVQRKRLAPPEQPVKTYDGRVVSHHARVIELDMVPGDLQQCADSLIRLRAEWLTTVEQPVMFHATSGDKMPYAKWQSGLRPYESGNRLAWKPGTKGGFESYLAKVFTWAGTRSLHRYDTRPTTDGLTPGDLLVQPGSPGHAVILLDVARKATGETYVLIGEGFMPAQSFHVELGPEQGWFLWDDGVDLGHWKMPASSHRRFVE